jgi:dephospho-CoA kinase
MKQMENNYLKNTVQNTLKFVVKYFGLDFSENSPYMRSMRIREKIFSGNHNDEKLKQIYTRNNLERKLQQINLDDNQIESMCKFDYE